MKKKSAEELLKDYLVSEELPHCYQIGCFSKRVTLHAQQIRAFNLVWALIESGQLQKYRKIVVIGGGLAGMTVSAGLVVSGCEVALYEETAFLMQLQRGNRLRFIHPNIFDWPSPTAGSTYTEDVPFLRWGAGFSDAVTNDILDQWRMLKGRVTTHLEYKVKSVTEKSGATELTIDGPSGTITDLCDAVVFCVGFGYEKTMGDLPRLSYWENDSLSQPVFYAKSKRFLVIGSGDGGLTDVLRLTIRDFNHAKFIIDLAFFYTNQELYQVLQRIEHEADQVYRDLIDSGLRRDEAVHKIGELLVSRYASVQIPDALLEYLRSQRRPDTAVVLNSRSKAFINPEASLINRFAVVALRKAGLLSYIDGEPSVILEGGRFRVSFEGHASTEPQYFDEVVVRKGPEHAIDKLIPRKDFERLRDSRVSDRDDATRAPHYERHFLRKEFDEITVATANDAAEYYRVEFTIGLLSKDLSEALKAAEGFVHHLASKSGTESKPKSDSTENTLRQYTLSNTEGSSVELTSTVASTTIGQQTSYSMQIFITAKDKALLDQLLNAEIHPYQRFLMFTKPGELLEVEPESVVSIRHDMSIMALAGPFHEAACIEVSRPGGFYHVHTYLSAGECLRILRQRQHTVENNLYERVVKKRA